MNKRVFSTFCSSLLLLSLWVGSFGTLSVMAQTTSDTSAKQTKNEKKSKDQKQDADEQAAPQTNPNGPLGVNDDPSMIGKRNINKGFTGWLGGLPGKKIKMGRQIAAQGCP